MRCASRARKDILCQGRGSAANSAVAYCLGITAVDPVRHGLLFERFLSEMRVDGTTEAPDIDVDIEHDRREEVLDYVYDNYDALARGDHVHRADVPRAQRAAATRCARSAIRSELAIAALQAPALRRAGGRRGEHARRARRSSSGSTSTTRAAARCSRRWRRSRDCRGSARPTSADSCSRREPLGDYLPDRAHDDGPHDHPVRQGRSRRASASRSSTSSDSARCRWCGARST